MNKPPSTTPKILAIHAHPDDVEILCAGTLLQLKEKGCPIHITTMTKGDCGSVEYSPEELSAIRVKEAQDAADIIGADYSCLEFFDLQVFNNIEGRRKVVELFRQVRPDIVLTAPPVDYMCDHEATSILVRDACFIAPIPNFSTGVTNPAPATDSIPHLYYVDPIEGVDHFGNSIQPDFIVDVSSTMEKKIKMLACHESQRNWLRKQHGMDEYLDSCRHWSALRGKEISAKYGEGFRQYKGHPYPQENLLLELVSK